MPAETIQLPDNRTSVNELRSFFPGSINYTERFDLFRANIISNPPPVLWDDEIIWSIPDAGRGQEIRTPSCSVVPIQTLAPEPYELVTPFLVIIEKSDDQYISSFADANISASGDTLEEAILNFKDVLLGTFDLLNSLSEDELGPMPQKQFAILKEYVKPTK